MKIDINKDLDTDFKNVIWWGLDGPELFWGGLSFAIIGVVAFVAGYYLNVPTQHCVMVGIPFAAPTYLLGFYKIQGLSVVEYLKEYIYDKMTEELTYEADERPENDSYWTMERESSNRRKKR